MVVVRFLLDEKVIHFVSSKQEHILKCLGLSDVSGCAKSLAGPADQAIPMLDPRMSQQRTS